MGNKPQDEAYTTGVIVACCGINFCMFASDKRKKANDRNDDNFDKIFKVNNDILFGGTGAFWNNEEVYEPIKERINDRLSIVDAVNLTEQYMYNNLAFVSMMKRNYFITGRDNDGIYYLVRVCLNNEEKSVQTISYVPKTITQKATMMALPRSLSGVDFAQKYNGILNTSVKSATTMPDIYLGCSKIIRCASVDDISNSVSDKISFLSIHD